MTAAVSNDKHGFGICQNILPVLFIEFWGVLLLWTSSRLPCCFLSKIWLKRNQATDLFSSFSALLYALLVVGGYLGDKVLGLRRTYLLGIIFLMIGYGSFG